MRSFYDDLVFDDRDYKDLFEQENPRQPFYADIAKRWVSGDRLTKNEQTIVTEILVFYPDYILKNAKTEEFIELLKNSLREPRLSDQTNPEKGLFLYTMLFMLLLHGRNEESLEVINQIERFFHTFCKNSRTTFTDGRSASGHDVFRNSLDSIYTIFSSALEKAYTEIVARIMDRSELLGLKHGFNISQLPLVRDRKLSAFTGNDLRGEALEFYHKQEYDKAAALYHKMLVNKFEQPGTLVHLARLEMMKCNTFQAEIYMINAWRMRREAPFYVQSRILYFIVLFKMLRSESFDLWLGCMKEVLSQPDSKMQWDMDRMLSEQKKKLSPDNFLFLQVLLKANSGADDEELLNSFEIWHTAVPINHELWPDFDIDSSSIPANIYQPGNQK